MILFWIIAGVLTLAAAVVLAAPLFDTRKFKSEDAFALEVYRDQLAELTRDEQRGLLTAEQARAAQIEIERRILALDEGKRFQPARPPSHALTLAMAVILPLAGFGIYLFLGSPHLPSQSAMERLAEERQRTSPEIQALEAKVEQSPSDGQSWIELGGAYADVERAKDAADAFAKAMALGRKEPDLLRQYAHAAIVAAGGRVGPDAQRALQRALAADPTDPTARFFLALAKAQNQDVEGALTDWLALEGQLPPNAPLRGLVTDNIDKAARQLGKDPATLPGRAAGAAPAGPSAEDMAAAARMSPEERQAFIESMVERLAAKMKENPDDLEGWIKLANAYGVLEKREEARAAWAEAAKRAPSRIDVQIDYAGSLIQGRSDLAQILPAEFPEAVKRIRTLDPENPLGMFYAGVVARAEGRSEEAKALWEKVLALMPEGAPERQQLQRQIDNLGKPAN
ncbi:c-type cytochrome biogenesis protein CcmI [Dongia deserti]|uniref:c-type cytochrome biogenesis protein CcmI n=1 Tax=Dongia deserti TaxID=2268030 RepID=UPI000E6563AF|nr:c-type cytochrome biogenesis protein CcmI [Dongia deserti]